MDTKSKRSIVVENQEISYYLERKNVKNLNLRVRKDGSVFVSANEMIPCEEIDNFIHSKGYYIFSAIDHFSKLEKQKPQPKQYVSGETFFIQGRGLRLQVSHSKKDVISSDGVYIFLKVNDVNNVEKKRRLTNHFLDQQCKTVFTEIMNEIYPAFQKYGIRRPELRIRTMETRWGSCLMQKNIITLNKMLLEAPRNCIEYVIMHEMCHLIHPNHSKHFYSFLTTLMPDWRERKKTLEHSVTYWL